MNYQITVIPSDNLISVNGDVLQFDFTKPEGIHAIQWSNNTGEIEFTDTTPNSVAHWASDVKPYYDMWVAEKELRDAEAKATAEAEANKSMSEKALGIQLTKREFLKLVIGLTADMPTPITLAAIEAYVAGAAETVRLEWTANHIERNHPMLDVVSASFGISSEMLDIMFVNKDYLISKIDSGEPLQQPSETSLYDKLPT